MPSNDITCNPTRNKPVSTNKSSSPKVYWCIASYRGVENTIRRNAWNSAPTYDPPSPSLSVGVRKIY